MMRGNILTGPGLDLCSDIILEQVLEQVSGWQESGLP